MLTRRSIRLDRALREFQTLVAQMLSEQKQPAPGKTTLRERHAELLGIYDEFPHIDCKLRSKTISVMTDSVILEEVYLRSFSIELDVDSELTHSVIGIDANPRLGATFLA